MDTTKQQTTVETQISAADSDPGPETLDPNYIQIVIWIATEI